MQLKIAINFIIIISLSLLNSVTNSHAATVQNKSDITKTSLIIDGNTGQILHARNASKKIYPASLTKIMTLYLIFEALNSQKLTMEQELYVSSHASRAKPMKLYLKPQSRITVKDTILALIVKSANDAARVAAENIAGSERKFARLMTIRARQLGMRHSFFTNASGLHHPKQVSTAVDLAKLTMAIKRDFPQYYPLFKKNNFYFRGKLIKGHNQVTETYPGAEGLKTGFTNQAGCNLITTAKRNGRHLIGIVTGNDTSTSRNRKMVELLDKYFAVPHHTIKLN